MKQTITMIKKEYSRTDSGKSWKSKADTTEESELNREQYNNMTSDDTCRFFRRLGGSESIIRSYTCIGYVPVQSISCNPDRDLKIVRSFTFEG